MSIISVSGHNIIIPDYYDLKKVQDLFNRLKWNKSLSNEKNKFNSMAILCQELNLLDCLTLLNSTKDYYEVSKDEDALRKQYKFIKQKILQEWVDLYGKYFMLYLETFI